MRLVGGRLAPPSAFRDRTDEGHIHLSLDGLLLAPAGHDPGLETSLHRLRTGRHTLLAEFVANDHGPFRHRVVASVQFTVR